MTSSAFAQILSDFLYDKLAFVDKFGGLVKPVDYQGKTLPLAKCHIGAKTQKKCEEGNNPLAIMAVLEDNQKGIVYFEQTGNIIPSVPPTKNKHETAFRISEQTAHNTTLRLVCIVNIRELGHEDICFDDKLTSSILSVLNAKTTIYDDALLDGFFIDGILINSYSIPTLTIENVFSRYNKGFFQRYEYYPYAYTAIDYSVSALVSPNCFEMLQTKPPLPPC